MSKRVKLVSLSPDIISGLKTIGEKSYEEIRKENEQREIDTKRQIKLNIEAEKKRIENLKCPLCYSKSKHFKTIKIKNGPIVYGGNNSKQKLAEYYICLHCGIMYVDLKNIDD
jgi:hypothetical protein